MAQQKQQCSTQAGSERGRPRWAGPPVAVGFTSPPVVAGDGTGRGKWPSLRDAPAERSERANSRTGRALLPNTHGSRTVARAQYRKFPFVSGEMTGHAQGLIYRLDRPNRRGPVPVYRSGLAGNRSVPVEVKFEFKIRSANGSYRYTGRFDR